MRLDARPVPRSSRVALAQWISALVSDSRLLSGGIWHTRGWVYLVDHFRCPPRAVSTALLRRNAQEVIGSSPVGDYFFLPSADKSEAGGGAVDLAERRGAARRGCLPFFCTKHRALSRQTLSSMAETTAAQITSSVWVWAALLTTPVWCCKTNVRSLCCLHPLLCSLTRRPAPASAAPQTLPLHHPYPRIP